MNHQRPDSLDYAIAWLVFRLCDVLSVIGDQWRRVRHWLTHQRVCAWCRTWSLGRRGLQRGRRLSGNPFARWATHTICAECRDRVYRQLFPVAKSHPRPPTVSAEPIPGIKPLGNPF